MSIMIILEEEVVIPIREPGKDPSQSTSYRPRAPTSTFLQNNGKDDNREVIV